MHRCRPLKRQRDQQNCSAMQRKHRFRDFVFTHDDHGRAMLLEMLDFAFGMGPRHDLQGRIGLSCLLDHLTSLKRIGDGDQQAAGPHHVGGPQHLRIGRIAVDCSVALPKQFSTMSRLSSITRSGLISAAAAEVMKRPTRP